MLRVATRLPMVLRAQTPVMTSFRAMSSGKHGDPVPDDQGHIPTDYEQATGVARQEELFTSVFGEEFYDRDPPSAVEEGTKENPIMVYSTETERYVGVSLEEDASIRWFCLKDGELAYDPLTMNYFAMRVVTEDDIAEAIAEAEEKY